LLRRKLEKQDEVSTPGRKFRAAISAIRWMASGSLLAALVCGFSFAFRTDAPAISYTSPLPQDTGAAELQQLLLRLHTTARLMQTTAHPDDEDGGMLTLESRGRGASVVLLTLNRGEGGQNKVGSNLFDELGILRTAELLAADRYYGVEQRFTHVVDFGFSKSPEETFHKWKGHDIALGDMVRVIRTFRPDVLVSRFSGTGRDGHGHHQAAGILTREAFRAAADPKRFPEQIEQGLQPWQATKLYMGAGWTGEAGYTLALNTGEEDPALGMSYVQFAMQGLKHQLSQGAGAWSIAPGQHLTYYKLADSVLPEVPAGTREKDFFDGIDTSVRALPARLGSEQSKVSYLSQALDEFAKLIDEATGEAKKDTSHAATALADALRVLNDLIPRLEMSGLSDAAKHDLLTILREKQQQCAEATNLAMNVSLEATVAPTSGSPSHIPAKNQALTVVSPGQQLTVILKFHNGSKDVLQVKDAGLDGAEGWIQQTYKGQDVVLRPGEDYFANFRLKVPANARYTRPYFHRDSPEQAVYDISDPEYLTLPFTPPPLHAHLSYFIPAAPGTKVMKWQVKKADKPGGLIATAVTVPYLDDKGPEHDPPLAIAPDYSVMLSPAVRVVRAGNNVTTTLQVSARSNVSGASQGSVHLDTPRGWSSQPTEENANFAARGEERNSKFVVNAGQQGEGHADLQAVLSNGGKQYREGYTEVGREDLPTLYYYQPATERISAVDVKLPIGLKVGYIMGAGDDIPETLKELGMEVALISPEELSKGDLSQYGTIVTGIRAYDTREDVKANNARLLDFVKNGGTLMVQYNTGFPDFSSGHYAPYSLQESRSRVTIEEAPVEILAPQESVFHYPNEIRESDFAGWVQERGLYFMSSWDAQYKALLSSHDPGEEAQKGGLLLAKYGKGTYIYNAYAFFRQLPEGVPGAVRLYVNLLSAGHEH